MKNVIAILAFIMVSAFSFTACNTDTVAPSNCGEFQVRLDAARNEYYSYLRERDSLTSYLNYVSDTDSEATQTERAEWKQVADNLYLAYQKEAEAKKRVDAVTQEMKQNGCIR